MQKVKNQLINICMPLLDEIRLLRSDAAGLLPLDFGDRLYQHMLTLEHQGFEKQIPGHHLGDTQYALAALIDEVIMLSSWPGKVSWMDRSLQLKLFGEHLAGVNFFQRLARIRQGAEPNLPVLEVYYVCLQLGFQGKYAITQEEELKALQVDIKHQLDLYKGTLNSTLSYDLSTVADSPLTSRYSIKPGLGLIGGAVIIAMLYGFYGFRLHALENKHTPFIEKAMGELS